ncbi:uncharacterized protein [Elaeis guineensis]|uniref:uncharacterized protein n=1 Tax=Elaeis guineensis var. tenera TaxID=51953 RepID=UPI003C6DB3A9
MASVEGSMPSMDDSSNTSSTQITEVRGKSDPVWNHCREAPKLSGNTKRMKLACLYCGKSFAGGGINRFKQHLAGVKGEVEPCRKMLADIRHQMIQNIQAISEKKKRTKKMGEDYNPFSARHKEHEEQVYYRQLDAIASMGPDYKAPNFHSVRGYLLTKNVDEVKKGTIFLKSMDASDTSKTADMLYKLFKEIVMSVGFENMVHIVTDNAANYVAAGKKLEQDFSTLFWSPCAAHCLNLIMQDIGKLVSVKNTVAHAAELMDKHPRSVSGLLDVIERYSFGNPILQGNLTNEMRLFRNAENDFGCSSAINDRSRLAPDISNLEDLDGDDGENDGNDANRREDGGDENIATQEDVFANIDINFSSLA